MTSIRLLWLLPLFAKAVLAYTPLPPSVDAFYQPPSDLRNTRNGDILRSRTVPSPSGLNVPVAASYQILYTTTDSNGLPRAALTTVLVPFNATSEKLFSMQNAYDSPGIDCAPSYELSQNTSVIHERTVIDSALSEGWYVQIPDYEGFEGAFTNGIYSGQALLDSLRAVLKSGQTTGFSPCARSVLVGGSGGALASEWALELHDQYAPELNISGALLSALPPNITSVFQSVEGGPGAPLIVLGLLGMAKQSLQLSEWLSQNLLPSNTSSPFLQAAQVCLTPFSLAFGAQNVSATYFGRENALLDDVPQAVMREVGVMGQHGIPRVPIFAYSGTADEVTPIADTDALVMKYCDAGSIIEYYRATNATHTESGEQGILAGWQWVKDRLDGVAMRHGCKTKNVTP